MNGIYDSNQMAHLIFCNTDEQVSQDVLNKTKVMLDKFSIQEKILHTKLMVQLLDRHPDASIGKAQLICELQKLIRKLQQKCT